MPEQQSLQTNPYIKFYGLRPAPIMPDVSVISEFQPKNVAPIAESEQSNRGWVLTVNGQEISQVSSVQLVHRRMGITAEYGKTEAGYDGLTIEEAGGGGAVIVPYLMQDGELYIGVVNEDRPNSGGKVLNVPRGFLDPGETHFQTATRELAEEAGYVPLDQRIEELGDGMNPNSTFFVAKTEGKGVKPFAVEVRRSEVQLAQAADDPENRVYQFNPDVVQATSKTGEKVMKSQFIHYKQVMRLKDMFTVAAVGRLRAKQELQGREPRLK